MFTLVTTTVTIYFSPEIGSCILKDIFLILMAKYVIYLVGHVCGCVDFFFILVNPHICPGAGMHY